MAFKPGDGIFGLKAGERTAQLLAASRVEFNQLSRIKAGVSQIATAATGNSHLCQQLIAFLKDQNPQRRTRLNSRQRCKKACRTTTDHNKIIIYHRKQSPLPALSIHQHWRGEILSLLRVTREGLEPSTRRLRVACSAKLS